jgi:hypothetical protein
VTEETRHRFLLSIAKQLPASRVAEVHLFPAMRQGGVESGVAVVALERELPVTIDVDGGYVPVSDVADAEPIESHAAVVVHDQLADESAFVADETESEDAAPSAVPQEDVAPTPEKAPSRFTVFSACYRHTLKGPDRGKWEVAITEEADAPLITVDAVVRGVQRRSGEVDEIYRMTGDEFRASLPTADA